ncbi:DUF4352 domain-containing protein [Rhodococcus sp. IEGM 1379]|uniref:DUF4352 domain-containing protein n=1 Tax=Rhodococcus sp. IEGM 1379 TaxID=3047086 RepID=UPI0024B68BEB|nr:DUF4352 domain-containing protein [Rhodococcus sp. IEGM 1379]MDI9917509.1 DUF4352 domain-containing protein [Rhodococcus sp. IEGM 1379]
MRSLRTPLVILAVGTALFATIASGESNEAKKAEGGGSPSAPASTFGVGDVVDLGDWRVQVHGVVDPYVSTNQFITADPGNRYVVIDTEVTNNGSKPETVSSMMCFELQDSANKSYDIAFTDTSTGSVDGQLASGAAKRGELSYEVPEAATGLRLQFKCDLLSSGSATINLS